MIESILQYLRLKVRSKIVQVIMQNCNVMFRHGPNLIKLLGTFLDA